MQGTVVYAVSSGSYSDYGVHAIFTTKEAAEQAAKLHGADSSWGSSGDVEEFVLYEEVPKQVTVYSIIQTLWDDPARELEPPHYNVETTMPWNQRRALDDGRPKVRYVRAPIYKDSGGRLEVFGYDEQGVKQAFSDNKARILEQGHERYQAGLQGLARKAAGIQF